MISLPNPPIMTFTMDNEQLSPRSDLATRQERLVGEELLAFIRGNESMNKQEQCNGAGYIKTLKDGSIGCNYTEFYMALLEAKGIDPNHDAFADGAWYDKLSTQDKDLYDMIEERCEEFTKLSGEQCQEFMDDLSDLGITTASQFEDAFCHQASTCHDESHLGDFVEAFHDEMGTELPEYLVIDWQESWYRNYRYDFKTIDFDGDTYFFFAHF